jgi:hypothetical protein
MFGTTESTNQSSVLKILRRKLVVLNQIEPFVYLTTEAIFVMNNHELSNTYAK